jgi:hypothetical protein
MLKPSLLHPHRVGYFAVLRKFPLHRSFGFFGLYSAGSVADLQNQSASLSVWWNLGPGNSSGRRK